MSTPPVGAQATSRPYSLSLIVLLLGALWLVYLLMEPFLHTIILATVFAAICYPLFQRVMRRMGGKAIPAAMALLVGLVVLVVIPVSIFIVGLVPQAVQTFSALGAWLAGNGPTELLNQSTVQPYLDWLRNTLPFLDLDLDLSHMDLRTPLVTFSRMAGQSLLQWGTYVLGNTLLFFGHFLLMLLVMFFLLKDGPRMVERIKYFCPLREEQEDRIISELRSVARSVLVGGLFVALVQGILGGVGLALAGLPALFWGTMMGFASLVPVVGTGLVWVPAVIYLLLTAQFKAGIFLALWSGIVVVGADSILRPYFMRGGAGMSVFFIFMSILGGIKAFGMLGIFYGPLILSFAVVMLTLYGEEFRDVLEPQPCPPCATGQDGEREE